MIYIIQKIVENQKSAEKKNIIITKPNNLFIIQIKRFYDRETTDTTNYEIHNPLPFYALKIVKPSLNWTISANPDKVDGLSANMVK